MFIMSNYALGSATFCTPLAPFAAVFRCCNSDTLKICKMRREFKIHCEDRNVQPDEVVRLFHFGRTDRDLAEALGVTVETVTSWKAGDQPVPLMAVKLLRLLDSGHTLKCAGPWNGSRAEGTRLHLDCGHDLALEFAELERLPDYRRLYHLHHLQTELIERLTIERDFYRRECHQQARFGMVVNQLFS